GRKSLKRDRTRVSELTTFATRMGQQLSSCSRPLRREKEELRSRMQFSGDENFALRLDAEDPLRQFREKFHLPLGKNGRPGIYFAGNSLGLMPKGARAIVEEEMDR